MLYYAKAFGTCYGIYNENHGKRKVHRYAIFSIGALLVAYTSQDDVYEHNPTYTHCTVYCAHAECVKH